MKKYLIRLYRIKLLLKYLKLFFNRKNNSSFTLLIPKLNLLYFFRVNFIWDLATLIHFKNSNISYNIVVGLKNIGSIKNSKVIYNPGYEINYWNTDNDVAFFTLLSKLLENQSNLVLPSSYEINFWENKSFMHESFNSAKIKSPKTYIVELNNIDSILATIDLSKLWLYKPNHSKSAIGIIQIKSNLENFLRDKLKHTRQVVIQEIINIDKDCRIILINDKVILQYWRNKIESTEWVPTSTSSGSKVSFMNYTKSLEDWVLDATKKLNLRSAAWDIVFDVNDEKLENPMALEVSPIYYPNPRENYNSELTYLKYKDSFKFDTYLLNEFITHIEEKTSVWKLK